MCYNNMLYKFAAIIHCSASMRLAYKDMAIEKKKHQEKIKHMDPKKQEQAERLGMGYASNR